MPPFRDLLSRRRAVPIAQPAAQPHYGVYPAIVRDVKDPQAQGRVLVTLPPPTSSGKDAWARVATLMAGKDSGTWFVPDMDDEVLVCFEGGDTAKPYVVGALWNDTAYPPESMDGSGNNYVKAVKTRNGITITFDDHDGHEQLVLETPGGQKLTLHDGPGMVEIVDSNGNKVKLDAAGIEVQASGVVRINANVAKVSAGTLEVDAGMAKFSGVVQCDTLISNSVVSSSYTPGAGNVW